jgi:hypothetical protein
MSYNGSLAQSAYGSTLAINTGTASTPVYTVVGEIINPKQTGNKNNTADVTNLNSTAEEFIATIPSPGNWDFTANRVTADTGQVAMLASYTNKTKILYKVTLPINTQAGQSTVGDSYTFQGIVETFYINELDPKKAITIAGSLKVSGGTTFAAGS